MKHRLALRVCQAVERRHNIHWTAAVRREQVAFAEEYLTILAMLRYLRHGVTR